jgi:starch-binding outer membrane protein, SusD/RagB family
MSKKMKKIVYILGFVLTFSSCEKLIEEKVYTSLDSEKLYENVNGCEAALAGVYSAFTGHGYYGTVFPELTLNLSGIYTAQGPQVDNRFGISSTTAFIGTHWNLVWQTIARANDVIFNVAKSPINEDVKNRIMGEAYFIRAKNYFDLVRLWGGVPLRLEPSTLSTIHLARTPADKVYEQILADLETAKKLLPEPAKAPLGRPHKFAANALAQKVYLTLAGNDPASPYWQKSIDEGLVVVNSRAYTLMRPYAALWEIKNENSKEGIFEIQGSAVNAGDGASLTRIFLPGSGNPSTTLTPRADTWGRAKVNKEVYDGHNKQYPNDPRIDITYLDSTYRNRTTNAVVNIYPITKTGFNSFTYIKKYVDPDYQGTSSNNNIIYMRYAEVLLMLAEAENELRGPAGAYVYINELMGRARDANGNGRDDPTELSPANWTGLTKEVFRTRIMSEYRYELLGELDEYFQVRRRGKDYFKALLDEHNAYPAVRANAGAFRLDFIAPTDDATMNRIMLLPIPIAEMSTNNLIKQSDQNPGY